MGKHFLWDPVEDNIVKEIDDAGTTIADYTTEPYLYGDLISQHRDGQSSFYHYDGQGSTTSLTNVTASVTDTFAYAAVGDIVERTGSTKTSFTFIGKRGYLSLDEGLFLARRRILLSPTGRWMSYDPWKGSHGGTLFTYCNNSPLRCVDPSGLRACEVTFFLVRPRKPSVFSMKKRVGGGKGFYYIGVGINALFRGCCECCEYRQFIRGKYQERIDGGNWIDDTVWGIDYPWHQGPGFEEDDGGLGPYGHRDKPSKHSLDKYDPSGCSYDAEDYPGIRDFADNYKDGNTKTYEGRYHVELWMRIIDRCNNDATVESEMLSIDMKVAYDNSTGVIVHSDKHDLK